MPISILSKPGFALAFCLALVSLQNGSAADSEAAQSPSDRILHYEPEMVRLEGLIKRDAAFGPPNYDKTSEKEPYYYLLLIKPVEVVGDKGDPYNGETEKNVKEMQLILGGDGCKALLGKAVIIDGRLSHAITGHHHTSVILEPLRIFSLTSYK